MKTKKELLLDSLTTFQDKELLPKLNEEELTVLSNLSRKGVHSVEKMGETLREMKLKSIDITRPAPEGFYQKIATIEKAYFSIKEKQSELQQSHEMSKAKKEVIERFKNECPEIIYVSEATAKALNELLRQNKIKTLKDVNARHMEVSRQLESNGLFQEYKQLNLVVSGLQYCRMKSKQVQKQKEEQLKKKSKGFDLER